MFVEVCLSTWRVTSTQRVVEEGKTLGRWGEEGRERGGGRVHCLVTTLAASSRDGPDLREPWEHRHLSTRS